MAITWKTRLRDLLAEHAEARQELAEIVAEIRRERPPVAVTVQNVTASGQESTAQGVIGGDINNYQIAGRQVPTAPVQAGDLEGGPR